ncbi:MAG: HAD family hydrolase [Phycisphaerales bacterium]
MSANRGDVLVAFDLGGVLVRICRSWHEGCDAAGLVRSEDPGAADPERVRELVSLQQRGEMDHAAFCQALARCAGPTLSAAHAAAVHDAWILGEYADVTVLLNRLKGAGIPTACLSNTNAAHWRQMEPMPFFARLDHRHASHLFRLEKPDPRIFAAFEREVGRRGAEIAYFDDLADNCAAARAAGWRVHQVDPRRETVPQIQEALRAWEILA